MRRSDARGTEPVKFRTWYVLFFFSSRRRHTRLQGDWSSDVCSSDLWTMGLLKPDDWQAQYVGFRDNAPVFKDAKSLFLPPTRQYRKEFAASKPIRRAKIGRASCRERV